MSAAGASPALLPSNPRLAREVFGFAPYWALSGNGQWDFSLLSTLAYFGLDVQSNGSFNTSPTNNGFKGWMSQDLVTVINRAHAANDRVVLVIKAFDNGTINAIVANILDMPQMFFFQPGYTSISRAHKSEWNDRWVIRSLNEDAHIHTEPNTLEPL